MDGPAVGHAGGRTALGVVNLGVSESPADDRHVLAELARVRGYRLVDVLTVDEETYLPTAYIAERVRSARVEALLAPSFEHFGVSGRVLPLVAELVVPGVSRTGSEPNLPREPARRQRNRMCRPALAVVALIALVIAVWALWTERGPVRLPDFAVIVFPDPAAGGELSHRKSSTGQLTCRHSHQVIMCAAAHYGTAVMSGTSNRIG